MWTGEVPITSGVSRRRQSAPNRRQEEVAHKIKINNHALVLSSSPQHDGVLPQLRANLPVGNPSTYFLFTFKDGRVNFHIFVVAKHVPRGVLAPVFAKERPNLRGNVIIKVAFLGRRRGFRQAWRTRSLGSALAVRGRDSVSTRSVGSRSRCRRGGGGLFDLGWSILRRRRSLDV